jgi:ketosteroid isomerase-like protein
MKIRSVVALVGLAISFALPTYAQQTNAPDPQLRDQLVAFDKKFDEAFNNNDAVGVAALITEDALFVTDTGPIYGRKAIEKCFADWFQNVHFSNHVTTDDQDSPHITGLDGNEMWATGKWSHIFQVQNGNPAQANGYWAAVKIREGDVWKMRMNIYNTTPAPPPTK